MRKTTKTLAAAFMAAGLAGAPALLVTGPQAVKMADATDRAKPPGRSLADYGLPAEYSPKALQRLLQMGGYDIGAIDGTVGPVTLHKGVREMLVRHEGIFRDLYTGKAEDLLPEELAALAPAVYKRAGEAGLDQIRAEPQRWTMAVRAIGAEKTDKGRTMVNGEFIITAPDGRELYIVQDNTGYRAEAMQPADAAARQAKGEKISRPQFNSGGVNFDGNGRATQKAKAPWNPYDGSAIAGLAGGTVYELSINEDLLNINKLLPKGFGDLAGNRSWIVIYNLDPEVTAGRGGFGIHVDGDTIVDGKANDGTAGCLGVREEYAKVFFDFLKAMTEEEEPVRVIILPPGDPALQPRTAAAPGMVLRPVA